MRNATRILLSHTLGIPQKIEPTNSEGYTAAELVTKKALTARALELQAQISELKEQMPEI